MKIWNAELLVQTKLILGEAAIWHPEWNKFLYVDIDGEKVYAIDPQTRHTEEVSTGKKVGTVAPVSADILLVALQGSLGLLNFKNGEFKELTTIEPGITTNRSNDGKCDPAGRLWLGTMDLNASLHQGALYCFDGSLRKVIDKTSVSNGLCWTADHQTMYYIDSFEYNIRAYDFDLKNGLISNERIVVSITDPDIIPDGMSIDEEGMLWVAMWGGGSVNRYNPVTGEMIGTVNVGVPLVTSCALGGKNMQQLFITTASKGLSEEELMQFPDSGSLFIVDVGVCGLPPHPYQPQ
ncbi:SMP-30/gluconolactonase/LRE family protein [Pedobacter nutrimenti]|uniref:SMP-30/gluconolactonase/LRE family protein n=1 Tax=Pedobacter nutrimenti TaxID=1241337 RepID=UPI00292E07D4|nr:SMP-30/gluconolactonase/LRE family protein [Pedobacter nutrimenti]